MPDLFISYAREDRDTAQALAEAVQRCGMTAWWDRALTGGGDFADEIEQNLLAAPVVVVLWSPASVRSEFVRDESSRARDLKKLLPVRIAPVELPLGFGTLHTLDLLEWDGDSDDEACTALLDQLRQRLQRAREPGGSADGATLPQPLFDPAAEQTLGQRRRRRRLLTGLAAGAAVLGATGLGGWGWAEAQRRRNQADALRRSEEHFRQGLGDQFAQPAQLERAAFEYRQALLLDPGMAPAHYYLAHLYAQMMLRGSPPPGGEVLAALRNDARQQFQFALANGERLDGAQRVIAKAQLALLDVADVAAPLARSSGPPDGASDVALAPAATVPSPPPAAPTDLATPPTPPADAAANDRAGGAAGTADAALAAGSGSGSGSGFGTGSGRPGRSASAGPPPLTRVPPVAAAQQEAQRRGELLFGADRDSRLAVTTTLTLDPALAADTLPEALRSATAALRSAPGAEATQQGLASMLALLERASPSTLRRNDAGLQSLLSSLGQAGPAGSSADATLQRLRSALALSRRSRPVVYLQIADERQRGIALALQERLQAAGYATPAIENTGLARAPRRPAVRSQGASDPDLARWCQQALSAAVGAPAELQTLRNAPSVTDTYELWFDAALCAPGGRSAAGCT